MTTNESPKISKYSNTNKKEFIFSSLKEFIEINDDEFDSIYPHSIRILSDLHWTPVEVATKAASLLVKTEKTKVLDIGSGCGKFCLIGASMTDGIFTGVEQRAFLVNASKKLVEKYSIKNVEFLHSNVIDIDFANYDSFYFFNSFEENILDVWPKIDSAIEISVSKYRKYTEYVYSELSKLKSGTRVVTYCSSEKQIPENYKLKQEYFHDLMQLWEKV